MGNNESIRRAIAEALGIQVDAVTDVVTVNEGMNTVYRAELSAYEPASIILKQQTVTRDGSFFAEPLIQRRVRESTDVPTPAVLATVFDDSPLNNRFFIMEDIDGIHPSPEEDDSFMLDAVEELGTALARIHSAPYLFDSAGEVHAEAGADDWYIEQDETWRQQLTRTIYNLLDDAEQQFRGLADKTRTHYQEAGHKIPNDDSRCLLHGDYRFANTVVDPDDASLNSVIDWGRVVAGDPVYNTARTAYLIRRDYASRPAFGEQLVDVFYDGYNAVRTIGRGTDDFQRRRDMYILHTAAVEMRWFSTWYSDWAEEKRSKRRNDLAEVVTNAIERTR